MIPPAPPLPRRLESEPAPAVESSPIPERAPPRAGVGPFGLDPDFADLVSKAISSAIADEMKRARASLAPAPTPAPPADQPPSEPPRSSIRVAAKKAPRWLSYLVTLLAVAGQLIVWFGPKLFPHYAGPLAQALKLVGWFVQSLGGNPAPPPDLSP